MIYPLYSYVNNLMQEEITFCDMKKLYRTYDIDFFVKSFILKRRQRLPLVQKIPFIESVKCSRGIWKVSHICEWGQHSSSTPPPIMFLYKHPVSLEVPQKYHYSRIILNHYHPSIMMNFCCQSCESYMHVRFDK